MRKSFDLDLERASTPFPPTLLAKIEEARIFRHANKQYEHMRQKRGEVTTTTLKRRRKGPPAHVLSLMTPEETKADQAVRSVSEVGYVGMLKRRMEWRLRDTDSWKKEYGQESEEIQAKLDRETETIAKENERRRVYADGDDK